MIDLEGLIKKIMNKDVNWTFDQSTDSLEAIRDFIAGGGATGGLAFYGVVTAVPGANQFTIAGLAGLGETKFTDLTGIAPYRAFVLWDAGGAAAAPQAENQPVTAYVSATGTFTTAAYTAAVAVGDEILLLHPFLASVVVGPSPSVGLWMFGRCDPAMVGSTNTILCPNLGGFQDDIFNNEFWMQVIHNVDAPGTAPEREWRRITDYAGATGTFTTDAFSANVEANDLVAVVHESILSVEILGFGTLDTSSTTVPADSARTAAYAWENNDYFKGCMLMPTEGACRFQPRPIRSYASATGVFTLDEPFTALPGAVDYVIIGAAYPVQRLLDIFNIVNALLLLTETGGTLAADGTEQTLYINNAPAASFEPIVVQVDCTNMQAGDVIELRTYFRINSGGGLIKKDDVVLNGPQDPDLKNIELEPNRYGVQVTLEQTAGTNRNYDWAVFYRS